MEKVAGAPTRIRDAYSSRLAPETQIWELGYMSYMSQIFYSLPQTVSPAGDQECRPPYWGGHSTFKPYQLEKMRCWGEVVTVCTQQCECAHTTVWMCTQYECEHSSVNVYMAVWMCAQQCECVQRGVNVHTYIYVYICVCVCICAEGCVPVLDL